MDNTLGYLLWGCSEPLTCIHFFFFFEIYLFEREGEGQKAREREPQADPTLSVGQCGVDPTLLRPQPEPEPRAGWILN